MSDNRLGSRHVPDWVFRSFAGAGAIAVALLPACGGGGGGSGSFESHAQLESVTFPDPNSVNPESEDTPPNAAPLVQQIVLTFSASPDPNRVSSNTVQIRDESNLPVPGSYSVSGRVVTFTPSLPVRPLTIFGDGSMDTGGTGLQPDRAYTLRVGPETFSFVSSVAADLVARFPDAVDAKGIAMSFRTTTDPANFFAGLPPSTPQLVSVDPADGETGVSPNLYTDPDQVFPPRRTFQIAFDRALNPDISNVSDATFRLIDLDDRPAGFPNGLPLGVDVAVLENEVDHSLVEVTPSGILPFGHMLALEYPTGVRSLSDSAPPTAVRSIASTFTIASAPGTTIRDRIVENFDEIARQETDVSQLGVGNLPAQWDTLDSNVLQASFAFQGNGVLGEFKPPAPAAGDTRVVTLDTTTQVFPLPDGSTPNAPPGFVVNGGIFSFTDIVIPDGIVLKPLGPNPLVLTATGSVTFAGDVIVAGENGTPENAYDSAVTAVPGGAGIGGGGRGGESHPIIFFPTDQVSYLTMVSPLSGGTGYGIDPFDGLMKRIGGTGGTCGALDEADGNGEFATNQEITDCTAFRGSHSTEKVPGGGGGSFLTKGKAPTNSNNGNFLNGVGNCIPDGTGKFLVDAVANLACGKGGQHPFFSDGNGQNDFYGTKGQVTRLIGGQGGGGGATHTESYYCGNWCKKDSDSKNDKVCCKGTGSCYPFVNNNTRAPSVGDNRGGGAGAGGGAFMVQALGAITFEATASIDSRGGAGMGGEGLGCSYWGGGGAGGSGGAIIVQSGTSILVKTGSSLDVRGGIGDDAENNNAYFSCDNGTNNGDPGDAGAGGAGLIQLQVPAGQTATVVNTNSILPLTSWVDASNTLNPVEFTPISIALSTWFDLGRVTERPPAATNPIFAFGGLDASGYVVTDANGNVTSPATTDIVVGYLGQRDPLTDGKTYKQGEEPRSDWIPPNASVQVEFQAADAIAEGSKEVDPATLTSWSGSVSIANGRQFLRWRITFDLTADGSNLTPTTRLPMAESLQVHAEF